MDSPLQPVFELINGEAYRPHPADAGLALGRRFAGQRVVLVGGGGCGSGWTQEVIFDRGGTPSLAGGRSGSFRRGSAEWLQHLRALSAGGDRWAVGLVEQQWQAALAEVSAASLGGGAVERMLRVRESVEQFGDERMAEDAVRVAVDHPTMEGAVVGGARTLVVEALQKEMLAGGFRIAAIRVPVLALLECHFAQLQGERLSPTESLVVHDGQSALVIAIRDGAFDGAEGGLSYVVNRPAGEVATQVLRRLGGASGSATPAVKACVVGVPLSESPGAAANRIQLSLAACDPCLAAVDARVTHDLRLDLRELRPALPRVARGLVLGGLGLALVALSGASVAAFGAVRLERAQAASARVLRAHEDVAAEARTRLRQSEREAVRARDIADWVDKNYHAQALAQAILLALPPEVSLDVLTLTAAEGLPQAKVRFSLLGSEPAQREALRRVEEGMYRLGYDVARREDPGVSVSRRGAVVYAWELIIPNFGANHGVL
jgi:hypothetical protein